jgi:hypothetical protein
MLIRVAVIIALLILSANAWAKDGRTYYTDERLGWMAENIDQYEWAQTERDKIIARADKWVGYDDEALVRLVPPLEVPRCGTVNNYGCPIHGDEILKYPGRKKSWRMSFDKLYKIQCPVGGEWYPSNDFQAYLDSGCEDKSLLTGEYVDDGWGCQIEGHEKKFWFVGFYGGEMTRRWLLPAINDMSRAYLLTGEQKYAHKSAVLLHQLAEYYPDYNYETQSRYGLEFQSWYKGRLQYHTWETFTIQDVTLAYDAIWPGIAGDAELTEFCGKDADGIRADIEDRILRVAATDITDGSHRIAGNYGMHQSALLRCALVLDTDEGTPTSAEMIDWIMTGPDDVSLYTDTPIMDALINLFHRDGVPFESPSYNCGWMTELEDVAELLLLNGVDLWGEPRFRGLYEWPLKMLVCGTMTQPMGDSNNMFAGGLGVTPKYLERAFQRIGDPRMARVMVQRDRTFRTDLFEKCMESEIRAAAEDYGQDVGITSELLPGLGYATLQGGSPDARFALALNYGYYHGHKHYERLNLEVYGYNHPLIPDLGYPETADTYDPRRSGWLEHSAVHNVVMVDATKQQADFGEPVTFHPGGWAQLVEARTPNAYPDVVEDYRRACFLIEMDATHSYIVDLFHVAGGGQHDWIIHGPPGDFATDVALPEPRTEGTLAGPDVPYGQFYDDPELIEGKDGVRYHLYQGSAFQWLFNVQEAALDGPGAVTWRLTRDPEMYPYKPTEGIGLRVHMLGDGETMFVCDGIPQRRKDFPEELKWVLRRRTGEDLASTFVSVFEPFNEDTPLIDATERVPVTPNDGSVAVRVAYGDIEDMIFWSPEPEAEHRFGEWTVTGRAACIRTRGAEVVTARLLDGESLRGPGRVLTDAGVTQTEIAAIDYDANVVTLDADALTEDMIGRWVTVDTGGHVAAVRIDEMLDARRFSLGDQDLRCGVASVPEIDEAGNVLHDRAMYFVNAGMTVVDEAGEVMGRVGASTPRAFMLTPKRAVEDFADADGDGRRRFTVYAIGTGDRVTVPCAVE